MKRILILFGFITQYGWAQNIGINTSGHPANAPAILDVSSSATGVLIPRMTTVERDVVVVPAVGLIIFKCAWYCYVGFSKRNMVGK